MAIIKKLLRSPAGAIGLLMLALTLVVTIATPILSPYDPFELDFGRTLCRPLGAAVCATCRDAPRNIRLKRDDGSRTGHALFGHRSGR